MDYFLLLKYFLVVVSVGILVCIGSFFMVYQESEISKYSAYECGFNPYGDARMRFDISYYIIAILFLIFDLELVFIYPFVIAVKFVSWYGVFGIYIFIVLLGSGLVYELVVGTLDWYGD